MEFARRLLARPREDGYSRLSVLAQYRARVEIMERVPRTAFRPRPRVDSAVVRISPRTPPYPVGRPEFFGTFLAAAFSHRRKTLRRALLDAGTLLPRRVVPGHLQGLPPELLERRAEELTGERLAVVSDALHQNIQ
jgi:16S rRNA (adenine1518-N6/adenine1519-N6)-dimethyltransferase